MSAPTKTTGRVHFWGNFYLLNLFDPRMVHNRYAFPQTRIGLRKLECGVDDSEYLGAAKAVRTHTEPNDLEKIMEEYLQPRRK